MGENALLKAAGLSVGYGSRVIASGIGLSVSAGEVLTLIGPNGAGKSTILKTLAGRLKPLGGNITICGRELAKLREKDIAPLLSLLLTQKLRAERMSCFEVAATGRYPYTGRLGILSGKDREAVGKAMAAVGISALADTDFNTLSDGQRQCVMLARAIAQDTKVMLLDEPTSFLDISRKLELLTILRQLVRERGIGVVMSLHELDLAQRFSDKVMCIGGGIAERADTPDRVFTDGHIAKLYGIGAGSYSALYGTVEGERAKGEPRVFVIGGGGSGVEVYRRLQREGVPFAAGILFENDIDCPAAGALAAEVVCAKAFEPIDKACFERAKALIDLCERVICCRDAFGELEGQNARLLAYAKNQGKLTEINFEKIDFRKQDIQMQEARKSVRKEG